MSDHLRLFAWNVGGASSRRRDGQCRAMRGIDADVITLTEVRQGNGSDDYIAAMHESGLVHTATSVPGRAEGSQLGGSRRYGVVVGSRWPLSVHSSPVDAPWPERILEVEIAHSAGPVRLWGIYAPVGSHGVAKEATFEALARRIAVTEGPGIVCGDLNTPQWEDEPAPGVGRVVTFGQRQRADGTYSAPGTTRKDKAERALLEGFDLGLADAYRGLHGYAQREYSWSSTRNGKTFDFRIDHILVRGGISVETCSYVQELRTASNEAPRLSDHAAIEATMLLPGGSGR